MAFKRCNPDDRSDRRYLFRIHNPHGLQYYKVLPFPTEKQAREHHDTIKVQLRLGGQATSTQKKELVGDYLQAMIDSRPLKPNARIAYNNSIKNHIRPRLGHLRVEQLENAKLLLLKHLKEIGMKTPARQGKRSMGGPTARHRAESLIREMLELAVSEGRLRKSPLAGEPMFDRPKPKQGKGIYVPSMLEGVAADRAMTDGRQGVPSGGEQMAVTIHRLQQGCGLRIGEAVAWSWDDIDMATRVLSINRQLIYIPHYGFIFAEPKEGADGPSYRDVVIPTFVWDALVALRRAVGDGKDFTLRWNDHEDEAAPNLTARLGVYSLRAKGGVYTPNSVQMRVRKLGQRIGAKRPLHPHAFRHSYTHYLRLGGVPGPDNDYLTGHKTKGTLTETVYGQSTPAGREMARDKIQEAWERAQRGEGESDDKLRVFELPDFN